MKSKQAIRELALSVSVFIIFSVASPKLALASHSAGGEITYTHLSGNLYKVHCAYYRDCFGIPAPTSLVLNIYSASCGINTNYTVPEIGIGYELSLTCPGVVTTCSGGSTPGFQKHNYELDIALPAQCNDWILSFTDCCRNAAITTLWSPGSESMYIEAHLNNLISDNNSPQFTNDPLMLACINQGFHYNNGMFDPDGDSLVYSLICARSAPNTCVTYQPPHSPLQPFLSNPPVAFDYFTGDYTMTPTAQEVGMVVYEVRDYRNGELMGSVMRDVMMYTISCSNQNPTATEMNGTSQQIAYVFPNDTICFYILSDDINPGDSVTMTWNNTIPGATFTTTTALHPTGTFCWTPTMNDLRSNPYMFTAMARDNYCPLNNAGVYSYYIYVTLDSSLVFLNINSPESNLFSISPNPSKGIFKMHSAERFSHLKIFNAFGECVLRKDSENTIDLSSQPAGIYFVEVETVKGKLVRQKFVKE